MVAIVAMVAAAPSVQGQVVIHLRSDAFATPVVVPDDPHQRSVTAFEIIGDLPVGGHGPGMITFDQRPVTFNEFGDPTRLPGTPVVPIPIVFKEIELASAKFPSRRTLEIVFLDGSLPEQMYLALGAQGQGPHRLIIRATDGAPLHVPQLDDSGWDDGGSLVHLIELYGQPAFDDRLPDRPVGSRINLMAMTVSGSKRGPTRLSVRGTIDGSVWVEPDGNQRTFDILGNTRSTTLAGYMGPQGTLIRVDLEDPAGTGRKLYELHVKSRGPTGLFLVRSPTERGLHRWITYRDGVVSLVQRMHDPERRYQQSKLAGLDNVSSEQRQAITDLRRLIGHQLRFEVEDGRVIHLFVRAKGDAGRLDGELQHLQHLQRLEFQGCDLGPDGLPSLARMPQLDYLSFIGGTVHDAALANLPANLRTISFRGCTGITDEGLAHLSALERLVYLSISRDESRYDPDPDEPLITDAGLAHLRGLTNLDNLTIVGQRITNAGLEHIADLENLTWLMLSGPGITDAGLVNLERMTKLRLLMIYSKHVTPDGLLALKEVLPDLMVMP